MKALPLALGILVGLVTAALILLVARPPVGEKIHLEPAPTPAPLVVSVTGAVVHPDLYELPPGSRVQDALESAGGLLPEADTRDLNLAAPLQDGDLVAIPTYPAMRSNPILPGSPAPQDGTSLVDLNTGTLEQLDSLPGIGPALARRIIDYREEHGPFTSISAVQSVDGIGPSTYERIKDYITVTSLLR